MMRGGTYSHVKGDILSPFIQPQMPYYAPQLSATPSKMPQICLNVKTLTFPMTTTIYSVETNRAKSFLQRLDLALWQRVLARSCFPQLSIILCVFPYSFVAVFTGFNRMVGTHLLPYICLTLLLLGFTAIETSENFPGK